MDHAPRFPQAYYIGDRDPARGTFAEALAHGAETAWNSYWGPLELWALASCSRRQERSCDYLAAAAGTYDATPLTPSGGEAEPDGDYDTHDEEHGDTRLPAAAPAPAPARAVFSSPNPAPALGPAPAPMPRLQRPTPRLPTSPAPGDTQTGTSVGASPGATLGASAGNGRSATLDTCAPAHAVPGVSQRFNEGLGDRWEADMGDARPGPPRHPLRPYWRLDPAHEASAEAFARSMARARDSLLGLPELGALTACSCRHERSWGHLAIAVGCLDDRSTAAPSPPAPAPEGGGHRP